MAARYATQNLNTALTQFALEAIRSGGQSIVNRIAPLVTIGLSDVEYFIFNQGKEFLSDWHDTIKAPKAVANEISRSYTSSTISLLMHALREKIADSEMGNADLAVINPKQDAITLILSKLMLSKEKQLNALLFDSTTTFTDYTAGASAYWDAGSGNTDIEGDIDAAKQSVRKNAGVEPNTIVIPPDIAVIAKKAPELRDLVVYTDATLRVNGDLPPVLFNLDVIIPRMIQNEADPGVDTASIDWIADDKAVWVGYVEKEAPSKKSLSCFYEFKRPINGTAEVGVREYREEDISCDVVEGMEEYSIEVPAPQAGYVISAVDA